MKTFFIKLREYLFIFTMSYLIDTDDDYYNIEFFPNEESTTYDSYDEDLDAHDIICYKLGDFNTSSSTISYTYENNSNLNSSDLNNIMEKQYMYDDIYYQTLETLYAEINKFIDYLRND